jgi:hypothetical protein
MGKIDFPLGMDFEASAAHFSYDIHPHKSERGLELLRHLRLLRAKATFAIAQSLLDIGAKEFQEVGLIPIKDADMIACFEPNQWSGQHGAFISLL